MKAHNYAEWNENSKLEITLESPKTESSKFSIAMQICSGEWMGRDLHVIRCSAKVTLGLIELVHYWHLSLKAGVARYRISFWMAIVPAQPLSNTLSHTRSQYLMFRMCFRDWCLLASIRVSCLSLLRRSSSALWIMDVASLGYHRHLSVIRSWVKWLSSHQHCWTSLISSTLHIARVRNVVGPSVLSLLVRRWARKCNFLMRIGTLMDGNSKVTLGSKFASALGSWVSSCPSETETSCNGLLGKDPVFRPIENGWDYTVVE